MYSEQGLLALMRPELGQVCQSLMVLSYCTPGSAQAQAALATLVHSSRAGILSTHLPVVRARVSQVPSLTTACMKASVTRTELLEFCPETVWYASPLKSAG
jgi:hypothetical protein